MTSTRRFLSFVLMLVAVVALATGCSSDDDSASENNGEAVPGEVSTTAPGATVSVPNTVTTQGAKDNLSDSSVCLATSSGGLVDPNSPQFAQATSQLNVVIQSYEANMSTDGLAALAPYKAATTNDAKATAIAEFNDWCQGDG